jgi:hypothetical protein
MCLIHWSTSKLLSQRKKQEPELRPLNLIKLSSLDDPDLIFGPTDSTTSEMVGEWTQDGVQYIGPSAVVGLLQGITSLS